MIKILVCIILAPVALVAIGVSLAAIVGIGKGFKDAIKKK